MGINSPDFVLANGYRSMQDSYVFVPGHEAIPPDGYDSIYVVIDPETGGRMVAKAKAPLPGGGEERGIYVPIQVPAVQFGQNVTIESIVLYYQLSDPNNTFISQVLLEERNVATDGGIVTHAELDDGSEGQRPQIGHVYAVERRTLLVDRTTQPADPGQVPGYDGHDHGSTAPACAWATSKGGPMKMRRRVNLLCVLAVLLGALLATGAAAADPGLVARDVYAAGGPEVSAGGFRLVGTAGEAVVAPVAATGNIQEGAGFWAKLPPGGKVYLPVVVK